MRSKHTRQDSSGRKWDIEGNGICKKNEKIERKKQMLEDAATYKHFEDI